MIYATPETNPTLCEIPLGDFPSIFLAGSIEDGLAEDWQTHVTARLAEIETRINQELIVLNPRREVWNSTWTDDDPRFIQQVNWEMDAMEVADAILFYFAPTTKAPITLLELGLQAGQNNAGFLNKSVVLCPKDFWRRGNVEIVCSRSRIVRVTDFEDLVSEAVTIARQNAARLESFRSGS